MHSRDQRVECRKTVRVIEPAVARRHLILRDACRCLTKLQENGRGTLDVETELADGSWVRAASNLAPDSPAVEPSVAHYKYIDTNPRLLPVNLAAQLLPGTFEHAVDHLLDHAIALSAFDARFRNDTTGATMGS